MNSVPRSSKISRSASLQADSQSSSLSRSKCSRLSWAASAAELVYSTSYPLFSTASATASARWVLPRPALPINSRLGLLGLKFSAHLRQKARILAM